MKIIQCTSTLGIPQKSTAKEEAATENSNKMTPSPQKKQKNQDSRIEGNIQPVSAENLLTLL